MRYGFLSYLNGTSFIRRVGEHEYAFTDAVGPCDAGPTVLEMLMCEWGGHREPVAELMQSVPGPNRIGSGGRQRTIS
jgi:hypothetical protein